MNLSMDEFTLQFYVEINQQQTLDLTWYFNCWHVSKLRMNWDSKDDDFTLYLTFENCELVVSYFPALKWLKVRSIEEVLRILEKS